MDIHAYGIRLQPISESDLELVRGWRNAAHVSRNMRYQNHISEEDQLSWFNSLTENDHYYLIIIDDKSIGLINVKEIDPKSKSGEAGIFIGDTDYLKSLVSFQATFCLMDHYFENVGLEKLRAVVTNRNENGLSFNDGLGYVLVEELEDAYVLEVTHAAYKAKTQEFREFLKNKFE